MRTAILDGAVIGDKRALHEALAAQLGFPGWYGHNLDALYDLLSTEAEPCRILLRNRERLEEQMGGYFRCFLGLLEDLRREGCSVETAEEAPRQGSDI
ncbi:MAG: barstar family protein [Oscillospiraceae bacterium]|nr:barstar family protein [Oscillospiraceae bacterium]